MDYKWHFRNLLGEAKQCHCNRIKINDIPIHQKIKIKKSIIFQPTAYIVYQLVFIILFVHYYCDLTRKKKSGVVRELNDGSISFIDPT